MEIKGNYSSFCDCLWMICLLMLILIFFSTANRWERIHFLIHSILFQTYHGLYQLFLAVLHAIMFLKLCYLN